MVRISSSIKEGLSWVDDQNMIRAKRSRLEFRSDRFKVYWRFRNTGVQIIKSLLFDSIVLKSFYWLKHRAFFQIYVKHTVYRVNSMGPTSHHDEALKKSA